MAGHFSGAGKGDMWMLQERAEEKEEDGEGIGQNKVNKSERTL